MFDINIAGGIINSNDDKTATGDKSDTSNGANNTYRKPGDGYEGRTRTISCQCFPLYSVLLALGIFYHRITKALLNKQLFFIGEN